jgi:hypothetical protein
VDRLAGAQKRCEQRACLMALELDRAGGSILALDREPADRVDAQAGPAEGRLSQDPHPATAGDGAGCDW